MSQTVSLYSKRGPIHAKYIFSEDFLETLNLRAFNKLSLDQDFSDIDLTCSYQLPVFEKVRPRFLWKEVFFIIVQFIKRGGWNTELRLREINIDSIFRGLNVTGQAAAPSEIADLCLEVGLIEGESPQ